MLTLSKSIEINASRQQVWDAITKPELIKKYFFGTDTDTTWKVGSPIFFRGEWEGKPYEDKGTVLAFEPGRMLRYNYWSSFSNKPDAPENYANIEYWVDEKNGVSTYTIVQDGIESQEAKAHSDSNWGMVMGELKKMLEEKK
ncbi:MAG: SRPBCC family protein [Bacteroidota bacterium]